MADPIKHHLDRNTAWSILNEGGVQGICLNTPSEREESVRKFLALGKKSETLFSLLNVSKHDALRRDVVGKLAEKKCAEAMETFQEAPDHFKETILEEVFSLAGVMPSNEPMRKTFVAFLKCNQAKFSESQEMRFPLLVSEESDEEEEPPLLEDFLWERPITDSLDGALIHALTLKKMIGELDQDASDIAAPAKGNLTVANLNITSVGSKASSSKAKLQRFCRRLEIAVHEYLSSYDRSCFETPFQKVSDQDFTTDLLKLNFESLRIELLGDKLQRMEEIIDSVIEDSVRRKINEDVMFGCFHTKPKEEVFHMLQKLARTSNVDTQERICKLGIKYFKNNQGYASSFKSTLMMGSWSRKISELLSIPKNEVNLKDHRDEYCLKLLAKPQLPFEQINDYIDAFQIPKNTILYRFLQWQFLGEDTGIESSALVVSHKPKIELLSYSKSINSSWKSIEPRLRWALRNFKIKSPINELLEWLNVTVRTSYERIRFLLEEILVMMKNNPDAEGDNRAELYLSDLEEFEKYKLLKASDGCDRLPFHWLKSEKVKMQEAIKKECCPTNYEKIIWVAKTSVVGMSETDVKMNCVKNLATKMRGVRGEEGTELDALLRALKISSKGREQIIEELLMNCRLYMHTARCIDDPARASKFLKEALTDLEQYQQIISEIAHISQNYKSLREYANLIDTKLVLSRNHFYDEKTRSFFNEGRQALSSSTILSLFLQLFEDKSYNKNGLGLVLTEVCRNAGIPVADVYSSLVGTWLNMTPIPVRNIVGISSIWDKTKVASAIFNQAHKGTMEQRCELMDILLKSFSDEEMSEIMKKLGLDSAGFASKKALMKQTRDWKDLCRMKHLGVSSKNFAAFTKTDDKVAALNHMLDTLEGSHEASKALGELAFNFELADDDLWTRIFGNFVVGDELFAFIRRLNRKKWFCAMLDENVMFDRTLRKIWTACIELNVDAKPALVVQALYDYPKAFLLDVEQIAFKLINKDHEVEALQIIPRAAAFDQREIFDRIIKAVTWKKLVSSVAKRNRLLLSHCEVSQMLLWTATPEELRKLSVDDYRWIKSEGIVQNYVDPFVQMLFRDNKFDEIKSILMLYGKRNPAMLSEFQEISRLQRTERDQRLQAMFDCRGIPQYFRPIPSAAEIFPGSS